MRWLRFILRTFGSRAQDARHRCFSLTWLLGLLAFWVCAASAYPVMAETAYDGYIVKLQEGAATLAAVDTEGVLEPLVPQLGLYKVSGGQVDEVQQAYPVEYVEPNYQVMLFDAPSNDTVDFDKQWPLEMLDFPFAWQLGAAGEGVRVGVIDSGVSVSHPALAGRVAGGFNCCTDNEEEFDDYSDTSATNYHGTAVAGIIAANSIPGVYSGATQCSLYALKAFDSKVITGIDSILKAISYGVDYFQCDVLNMSFGMPERAQGLEDAIQYAASRGVILIAASGNTRNGEMQYPAGFEGVIGVGGIDKNKVVGTYSTHNESVFISAPGSSVYVLNGENGYATNSGTSFAAPHVTAAAAVLKGLMPDLTYTQLTELLRKGAEDLGAEGYDPYYGWGLLNMEAMQGLYRTGVTVADDGTVSFRLTNYTDRLCSGINMVTACREETMIGFWQAPLCLEAGASVDSDLSLPALAEGDVVKGMLWDGADTISPLLDVDFLQ